MKQITTTNKFEKAFVLMMNTFSGWDLEWVGDQNLCYDAKGKTPKGYDCVIELKFRKKYYETKMLEKKKLDALMELPKDVVKIYFISDPKGNYWYWLDKLKELNIINKNCPQTSYWSKQKIQKEVYLLTEAQASLVEKSEKKREQTHWEKYFSNKKPKKSY